MLEYFSEMEYVTKLFLDIAMWIIILVAVGHCIRRNPTDYDTNYRKRFRMIMAGLCFFMAISWIFISTKNISLPFYYLHTFGTFTPSDTMIHYGMLSNVHMYESWDKPIFALPTYEQWLVLSKINSVCLLSAVGLIFLLYKKSSTRIIAKVRKVFGYIFLLLVVPSALDTLSFSDWVSIILVIVILILTLLLLKTYKKDEVVPVLPVEAMLYGENKDFSVIEPEVQVEINEVTQEEELKETEQEVPQTEEYDNIEDTQKEENTKNEQTIDENLEQNEHVVNQHLTFKGTPIDGTLSQYTQRMKEKGFTYVRTEDGISVLEGDFAGFKNCYIHINTLQTKDLVSCIAVRFKEYDTWSAIYNNYSTLKDMLTMKYGEPSEVIEEFQSSYVDNDHDRMYALMMDRCEYVTTFETELGTIELFIIKYEYTKGCVMMKYTDRANNAILHKAVMEDL